MDRDTIRKILIVLALLLVGITFFEFGIFPQLDVPDVGQSDSLAYNSRLTYGRFLDYLEMGWVKQVDLYDNGRNAIVQASSPELANRDQQLRVEIPIGASQLIQKLKEYNIDFDAHSVPEKSLLFTIASNLILPVIFILGLFFLFQSSESLGQNGNGSTMNPMNLGKSPARVNQQPKTGVNFADVAGVDEAKAEFQEIVSFLKEPERYTVVGAKIPKGVLLLGPPGTGKTLLAKAIANEANVPFYNVAGSEFVEMFIGVGASRVRDLFKNASENTPCIVFIDEIDAVGRERGAGIGGGNDEREQTLNQLLTEMDGFKENKGVIVIGATNRADILDPALLRPGRFDREITIGLPDRLGRIEILKVHSRKKPLAENVSLVQLANRTPGFSGADLANVLNESAILATRYKKFKITRDEVNEAIDRMIGGIAGASMDDTKSKKLVAYHEVGHAIIATVLEDHDNVEKVTLIPRGGAKGLTWFTGEEDQMLVTRSQLFARITTALGGRAAEKVIFGDTEVTTGASNDLQQATSIARKMVTRYGMSKIGPIALENNRNEQFLSNGRSQGPAANRVDIEISEFINYSESVAKQIILENRPVIDSIVEKLLEVETIDGDEFRRLVKEYTIVPPKRELRKLSPNYEINYKKNL